MAVGIGAVDWHHAPEFGRRTTILAALRRLHHLNPGPVRIVETGTLRTTDPGGQGGDGWSTVAWGWYCSRAGGRVWTVDVEENNLRACREVTASWADFIEYVHSDSVAFLSGWSPARKGVIDLLYLDSFDYFDRPASEAHNLREAEAALPSMSPACLVLIDDCHPADGSGESESVWGKGALTVPFLRSEGFRLEWCEGGQALLRRLPEAWSPGGSRKAL